ncbi:ubiquitin-like small modifier protein 1 [Methanomethylovorans sp.]|uniref:ubiquitin-like small modifier protein 1 n=1 Tax=Methanomethylovorans sp. TaxID=2758717 RepID=UPI000A9286DA|nr:ubiquitin-like small modifier protein 1 [Methanomethylovorans sp.]
MAEVKVRLFANLKEVAGTSELILPGDTVLEVLEALVRQFPDLKDMIFETTASGPRLCGYVNVFLNGDNIGHLDGLWTNTSNNDELGVLPPVSGG